MSLRQVIAQSPSHDADATFSMAIWVGTIGGATLGTDPNPNTTPPSAGRILRIGPKKGAVLLHGAAQLRILCATVAASSITFQPWLFDATQNLWIQFGAPIAVTPTGAAINQALVTMGNFAGAQVFVQVTANTLVQAFGYDYM